MVHSRILLSTIEPAQTIMLSPLTLHDYLVIPPLQNVKEVSKIRLQHMFYVMIQKKLGTE